MFVVGREERALQAGRACESLGVSQEAEARLEGSWMLS